MRLVQDEAVSFLLDRADVHEGFAEVPMRMSGRMRQRHEHLKPPAFALPHVGLHDREAAAEAVLIEKPVEHPLGRLPLLVA